MYQIYSRTHHARDQEGERDTLSCHSDSRSRLENSVVRAAREPTRRAERSSQGRAAGVHDVRSEPILSLLVELEPASPQIIRADTESDSEVSDQPESAPTPLRDLAEGASESRRRRRTSRLLSCRLCRTVRASPA